MISLLFYDIETGASAGPGALDNLLGQRGGAFKPDAVASDYGFAAAFIASARPSPRGSRFAHLWMVAGRGRRPAASDCARDPACDRTRSVVAYPVPAGVGDTQL